MGSAISQPQCREQYQPAPLPPPASLGRTWRALLCAGTWGPQAEWGEHEMDYILFIRAPAGGLTLQPNPEEVMVSACLLLSWR